MKQALAMLHRLLRDEEGATVVEYAVILALIIAGVIVIISILGIQIQTGLADFNEAYGRAKAGQ